MAEVVKVLTTKPGNLSLIHETHMVYGENKFLQVVLQPLHPVLWHMHICIHVCAHKMVLNSCHFFFSLPSAEIIDIHHRTWLSQNGRTTSLIPSWRCEPVR